MGHRETRSQAWRAVLECGRVKLYPNKAINMAIMLLSLLYVDLIIGFISWMTIMFLKSKSHNLMILTALTVLLSGCTTYKARPLPSQPDLAMAVTPSLVKDAPYPIKVEDGLDMTETAALAVLRNPDLRAARLKKNVVKAQAFSSGLFPDPQFTGNIDHPTGNAPGFINGYTGSLQFDVRSLFTHGASVRGAEDNLRSSEMDILWQEWQTIQKARSLYVQRYFTAEKIMLLKDIVDLYAGQSARSGKALAAGDVTLEQAGADITALMDARTQLRNQERDALTTDNSLNALLGLSATAVIRQQGLSNPVIPPDKKVKSSLETVATRRPDLIALQAAYQSQEETLYKAVLQQFPSISIGISRARDTSDVHTMGLGVTMDLPLFNGSKGEIAVQSATRDQLWQEYQARLDTTRSEADVLWRQTGLLAKQIDDMKKQLPKIEDMAAKARKSSRTHDLPELSYVTLENSLLSKKLEYLDLQQSLWTNLIGLDTVLAWPVLPVSAAKDENHVKKAL